MGSINVFEYHVTPNCMVNNAYSRIVYADIMYVLGL